MMGIKGGACIGSRVGDGGAAAIDVSSIAIAHSGINGMGADFTVNPPQ
jgi:hypothetical protein